MDTPKKPTAKGDELHYLLKRGVAEIIPEDELRTALKSGRKLRLKEGLDPSSSDIHLGHMVGLRKLRQFQELGHTIVLIIGDWTAQVGDPSGVSVTRPMLTREQVEHNARTYMDQFFKIVDKEKTEVRWQSEWFGKFDLGDVIRLAGRFTVAQFLARDDFNKRFTAEKPIALSEFLYPLMQAYDSVAIQADVEFGGTDQKFNLLVGRQLQEMLGQKPQQCFTFPLLVGTDGVRKMSKSLGNYIGITEPPEQIFGKVMSITDNLILQYFELLTDVPDEELDEFKKQLETGSINPMELKKRLAKDIIVQLYDETAAEEGSAHFARVVQNKEIPDDMPEYPISFHGLPQFGLTVTQAIVRMGFAKSGSDASRLIKQGAVRIDKEKIDTYLVPVRDGSIVQVGPIRFFRIVDTDKK